MANTELKLAIEITLTKQNLEDMIVTALEGGSNYWYQLGDVPCKAPKNEPLSIRIANYIWGGGTIPIYDGENCDGEDESEWDKLGDLSIENIKVNLVKLIGDEGYSGRFWNLLREDFDADDADVIFQYCVMGEVVFG